MHHPRSRTFQCSVTFFTKLPKTKVTFLRFPWVYEIQMDALSTNSVSILIIKGMVLMIPVTGFLWWSRIGWFFLKNIFVYSFWFPWEKISREAFLRSLLHLHTPVLQYFSFLLDLDKGRLTKIMSFGRSLLLSFCSFCLSVFLTFEHAFLSKEYDFIVFLSRTTSCIDLVVLLEKVTFKCNRMCCNKTNIMSGEISSFTNLIGRNVRTVDCSRRFQMKMYWAKFTIGFLKTVLLLLIDILS